MSAARKRVLPELPERLRDFAITAAHHSGMRPSSQPSSNYGNCAGSGSQPCSREERLLFNARRKAKRGADSVPRVYTHKQKARAAAKRKAAKKADSRELASWRHRYRDQLPSVDLNVPDGFVVASSVHWMYWCTRRKVMFSHHGRSLFNKPCWFKLNAKGARGRQLHQGVIKACKCASRETYSQFVYIQPNDGGKLVRVHYDEVYVAPLPLSDYMKMCDDYAAAEEKFGGHGPLLDEMDRIFEEERKLQELFGFWWS
jgi:putative lipoic acid-binding regulatory protein